MSVLSRDQIVELLVGAGFKKNGDDTNTMVGICYAESGGDPSKHNSTPPDDSYGLWQINMLGSMGPDRRKKFGISNNNQLFDPATNAHAAHIIYKDQGLNAWTTYTRGTYLKYMDGTTGREDGKDSDSSQPLPGLPDVGTAITNLGSNLFKGVSNVAGVIVALVLIILGIVLLSRNALPTGKAVNIAKKVLS